MDNPEEEQAYKVLAKRFGCSANYIKVHFESPSEAGYVYEEPRVDTHEECSTSASWTLDEIRRTLERFERLRRAGKMKPLERRISMDRFKKGKGKHTYCYASDEELQQELELQEQTSIDPDGNLVINGQIVKCGWLQSFAKKSYE